MGAPQLLGGVAACAISFAGGVLLARVFNNGSRKKTQVQEDNVYEDKKTVDMYLLMHYGEPEKVLAYPQFGSLKEAVQFPVRCAEFCPKYTATNKRLPSRALEIGCSVGRTAFELTKFYDEVIAIDYSQAFIDTANNMKRNGYLPYEVMEEGELTSQAVAKVSNEMSLDRSRVTFEQGDGCNLREDLGQYAVVLGCNLLCRLPDPQKFLVRCRKLVVDGGYLVLASPYSWLKEFTPRTNWVGGYRDEAGNDVESFPALKELLRGHFELEHEENIPFFIREHAHKNQCSISHLTVWRRTGGATTQQ